MYGISADLSEASQQEERTQFFIFWVLFDEFKQKYTKNDQYWPKLQIKFYEFVTGIILCIWYNVPPIKFIQIGRYCEKDWPFI